MQPIPATLEAIKELTRHGDTEVATALSQMNRDVMRLVPECVGLSLSLVGEELTFTLTASGETASGLDGFQYLGGGPCEDAVAGGEVTAYGGSRAPIDEERWLLFARAAAAAGVASTLSLPIVRGEDVVAVVNLYASTSAAFDGRHSQVAAACGAWAPGAITNADLGFGTTTEAIATPERLRANDKIDQAVGIVAALMGIHVDEAKERIRHAADRAGIPFARMAEAILQLLRHPS